MLISWLLVLSWLKVIFFESKESPKIKVLIYQIRPQLFEIVNSLTLGVQLQLIPLRYHSMRKAMIIFILLVSGIQLKAQDFFVEANDFFARYVADGLVKYDEIIKEPESLNKLVEQIGRFKLSEATASEQKAFYINAYNILIIYQILKNYPTEGPLEIEGFFDQLTSRVAGEHITLNQLEKERLFKAFPDPRLHFVLVCAAMGCPPLADFAYVPDKLEKQLQDRTRDVLNFQTFILVNENMVQISKIFEWYESDFVKDNNNNSVISYIDRYHSKVLSGRKWSFYEYDWSLNKY